MSVKPDRVVVVYEDEWGCKSNVTVYPENLEKGTIKLLKGVLGEDQLVVADGVEAVTIDKFLKGNVGKSPGPFSEIYYDIEVVVMGDDEPEYTGRLMFFEVWLEN